MRDSEMTSIRYCRAVASRAATCWCAVATTGAVVNLASCLVDEADPLANAAVGCHLEPAGRRMIEGLAEPISVKSLGTG